jgi:hypothetical protein
MAGSVLQLGASWYVWLLLSTLILKTVEVYIIVYIEYQSFCPLLGIGSPTPYPASECGPPRIQEEEGSKRGRVRVDSQLQKSTRIAHKRTNL